MSETVKLYFNEHQKLPRLTRQNMSEHWRKDEEIDCKLLETAMNHSIHQGNFHAFYEYIPIYLTHCTNQPVHSKYKFDYIYFEQFLEMCSEIETARLTRVNTVKNKSITTATEEEDSTNESSKTLSSKKCKCVKISELTPNIVIIESRYELAAFEPHIAEIISKIN